MRARLFLLSLGYFSYEMGVQGLLVGAAWRGLRRRWNQAPEAAPAGDLPTLTVLIAAHNERSCIVDTLESVFAQEGGPMRVIVASDGSHDGMNELLIERYGLQPAGDVAGGTRHRGERLVLLALPKLGKGLVLNAALAEADGELVATLDADTRLAPGALAALAGVFRDPRPRRPAGLSTCATRGPAAGWCATNIGSTSRTSSGGSASCI